jgi:hypothetical protein
MKPHEQELRDEMTTGHPFTLVTASGERVRVHSRGHIILPPLVDEDGLPLQDDDRSDFFQVWTNGRRYRWVAFSSINIIEAEAPIK